MFNWQIKFVVSPTVFFFFQKKLHWINIYISQKLHKINFFVDYMIRQSARTLTYSFWWLYIGTTNINNLFTNSGSSLIFYFFVGAIVRIFLYSNKYHVYLTIFVMQALWWAGRAGQSNLLHHIFLWTIIMHCNVYSIL